MKAVLIIIIASIGLLQTSCSSGGGQGYNRGVIEKLGLDSCIDNAHAVYAVSFSNGHDEDYHTQACPDGTWIKDTVRTVKLTDEQIYRVTRIVGSKYVYSDMGNKCSFDPHHSIVYFDESGSYLGEICICFRCRQLKTHAMPYDMDVSKASMGYLEELFSELGFEW